MKKTLTITSTRNEVKKETVMDDETEYLASMTRGEYLAAILAGYPGQGTMIEKAYATKGISRANGMFLS